MVFIGTSGFSYPYWKNKFYPENLPASRWLQYYSTQFNTLELNSSFYRFPRAEPLKKAASQTPDDFVFTVKAHKVITHTRRMRDVAEKIVQFMDIAQEGLGEKLGCVLYQMPPSYGFTEERLEDIVRYLGLDHRNVIEFRNASWWNTEIYRRLEENNIHFCSVSFPGLPEDNIVTGGVFYRRMHGVPKLFQSSYSDIQLLELAEKLPDAPVSFVYFNNTTYEAGYSNAWLLEQFLLPGMLA